MGARYTYFDSMNSFNLIEILAETFNIYTPDINTLRAEAFQDTDSLVEQLLNTREGFKFQDSNDNVKATIEEFLKGHDKFDIKKIDLLKINAIEILMNITQFAPSISIRTFVLSED